MGRRRVSTDGRHVGKSSSGMPALLIRVEVKDKYMQSVGQALMVSAVNFWREDL